MADTLKVLGQAAPAADTDVDLYVVPASKSAVISSLVICERSGVSALLRIAVRPSGAALTDAHYIYHDTPLPAHSTLAVVIGITLATTDVVTVRSSTSGLSFSLFGTEVG